MKEIKLTQGQVALIDDDDYEELIQYTWCAGKVVGKNYIYYYPRTSIRISNEKNSKYKMIYMHQLIMGGKFIDHIDHNTLNNQKYNLRSSNNSTNMINSRKSKNTSSIYKGVCFHKKQNKWVCNVSINGKNKYFGSFINEIDAAKKYDDISKIYNNEFCYLNFP